MNQALINKLSNYFSGQPIEKAYVFGSFARSEENQESDIDILVNFSAGAKMTIFKYAHIVNDLESLTGKKIDLVEDGQLKPFAKESSDLEKILIYERKTQG